MSASDCVPSRFDIQNYLLSGSWLLLYLKTKRSKASWKLDFPRRLPILCSGLWLRYRIRVIRITYSVRPTRNSLKASLLFHLSTENNTLSIMLCSAVEKLRKATISFVVSVCESAWDKSAPNGRISMTFFHCFAQFIRTNSCTFSYNYVLVF
jgi:hypothetical protein